MSHFESTKRAVRDHVMPLLDDATKKLIGQATFDLHYGPSGDDSDYPGFVTACKRIARALDDVPRRLFVDDQDCVCETEPKAEQCEACSGVGLYDDETTPCADCNGKGYFEPTPYVEVDVAPIIVGRELAPYLR